MPDIGIPIEGDHGLNAPYIPTPPHPPIGLPAPPVTPSPEPGPAPEPAPAPEPEPTLGQAMPDLGNIAWLLVLLGLIAVAVALVDFFNWLFRSMLGPLWPRSGSKTVTAPKLTQALSNSLGQHFDGLDGELGQSFQKLAQLTTGLGGAILAGEKVSYQIAVKLARVQGHAVRTDATAASARQQAKAAQATATEARQSAITAAATAAAANQTLQGRLDDLTHHVTRVLEPELEHLRHKIPELEKGAIVTWDEIKKHDLLLGAGAMTAAVAAGLGHLGGSWIRCENNQDLGKKLCGTDPGLLGKVSKNGIEDALALLVSTAILLDFRAYVELMQRTTEGTAATIKQILRVT
jgi:hypothetical protein